MKLILKWHSLLQVLARSQAEKDRWPAESQTDRDRISPASLQLQLAYDQAIQLRKVRSARDTETLLCHHRISLPQNASASACSRGPHTSAALPARRNTLKAFRSLQTLAQAGVVNFQHAQAARTPENPQFRIEVMGSLILVYEELSRTPKVRRPASSQKKRFLSSVMLCV